MTYADQIRTEANAKSMRSLIANGIEENKAIADDAKEKATDAQNRVNNIINSQDGQTPVEVIDGRYDEINNKTYNNLGERLNDFSASLNDNTNELIAARQGENSLLNLLKKQKSFLSVVGNTADDINTAIITAYTLGIGAVYIPRLATHYTIDKEIHVYSGVNLISNGAFLKNFMTSGCMIRNHNIDAAGYNGDTNIVIDGLVLDADSKEVVPIALAHTKNCVIKNNIISNVTGVSHCIDIPANYNLLIENNKLINCVATMLQIDQALAGSLPTATTPNLNEDSTSSKYITIKNNYFELGQLAAIHLHKNNHQDILLDGNIIVNCNIGIVDDNNYSIGHNRVTIVNNKMNLLAPPDYASGHGIILHSGISNSIIANNTILPRGFGIVITYQASRDNDTNIITGNTIRGGLNNAINCDHFNKGIIANNTIYDFGDGSAQMYGIRVANSSSTKIDGNYVATSTQTNRTGINVLSSSDIDILGNKIVNCNSPLVVNGDATTQPERIKISQNTITGALAYGIHVVGYDATKRAKNIIVIGNIVKDVTQLGIRLQYIDTAVVSENEVLNILSGQAGFSLSTFKNGTVNGNIVVGASGATYGITISGAGEGYSSLIGNRISGCVTGIGILSSADYCALIGNIITGATTAVDAAGVNNVKVNNIAA